MNHYLSLYGNEMGRQLPVFEPGAMDLLINYAWPGNVRQLQNIAQRILFLSHDSISIELVENVIGIRPDFKKEKTAYNFDPENILSLKKIEKSFRREYFRFVRRLSKTDAEAAQKLDLAPPNYYRIAKELGLK